MKSLFNNIGTKDTDFEILKYVEDKDIRKICLLNRYSNQTINSEKFWLQRFFQKYGLYLKNMDINYYRSEMSWKKYYIQVNQYVNCFFPYFSSALALAANRYDICVLLNKIRKINNVIKIEKEDRVFYTRNGNIDGIKEGEETVSNKTNNIKRLYQSDKLLKEIIYKNNVIKSIKIWDQKNSCMLYEKWNNGTIILSEKLEIISSLKFSESKYENGKIKSVGKYLNNRREGIWYIFDRNENLTIVQYNKGKKLSEKNYKFGEYDKDLLNESNQNVIYF